MTQYSKFSIQYSREKIQYSRYIVSTDFNGFFIGARPYLKWCYLALVQVVVAGKVKLMGDVGDHIKHTVVVNGIGEIKIPLNKS